MGAFMKRRCKTSLRDKYNLETNFCKYKDNSTFVLKNRNFVVFSGYGPPPFFPRGLRPPFPGAVPRFGRYPPPHAFRGGRPPMSFMRYPRGIYMRPPRHNIPDEEEPEEEDDKMSGEESSGGPKSLMSIRIQKDVKETVKAQILSKGEFLLI